MWLGAKLGLRRVACPIAAAQAYYSLMRWSIFRVLLAWPICGQNSQHATCSGLYQHGRECKILENLRWLATFEKTKTYVFAEPFVRDREVGGSNPLAPTTQNQHLMAANSGSRISCMANCQLSLLDTQVPTTQS
jgi:hypothetical protein